MQEAEGHFQRREYDEALAVFQQARKRRPYNVHPKVKIQDLEAFIKERDRKAAAQKPPVERTALPSKAPPTDPAPVPIATANIDPVGEKKIEVKGSPDPPEKAEKSSVEKPVAKVVAPPPIGERIYKEAGAVVIERVIEQDGRPVIYKKVIHRSGDMVHFRNGLVITQRAWLGTFGY